MRYIHVRWLHDDPEEPIELYSELDGESWEVRKVEVFRDGRIGFADALESTELTSLGLEPVPPLEEIALDPQFQVVQVTQDEFELLWNLAHSLRVHIES